MVGWLAAPSWPGLSAKERSILEWYQVFHGKGLAARHHLSSSSSFDVHVDDDAPVAGIARGGRQSGRHTSIWLAINHNANRQRSCRRHPGDKLDKHIERIWDFPTPAWLVGRRNMRRRALLLVMVMMWMVYHVCGFSQPATRRTAKVTNTTTTVTLVWGNIYDESRRRWGGPGSTLQQLWAIWPVMLFSRWRALVDF